MKKCKNIAMAWKESRYETNTESMGHCEEMQHHKQEWSDRKTHPKSAPWQLNTNYLPKTQTKCTKSWRIVNEKQG